MTQNKAPRNKTIDLSDKDIKKLLTQALKINHRMPIEELCDKVIYQDTFKVLDLLPKQSIDLMIVDPPYNLTKSFGQSIFKEMDLNDYKKWFDKWLKKTIPLLKETATVYICADWKSSIIIPEVAGKYLLLQNRISWEREKGRGALNNWKNCLEDIWFFTRSKDYIFNINDVKIQRKVLAPYRDDQGAPKDWQESDNKKTRLTYPSNIWTDISVPFWSMPENTNHPTQKPEKLIAKLILASSNKNDIVFDPFLGSGTTAVTAKKLSRHFVGIEKEKEYVALALKRLQLAESNPTIQGYENGVFKARNGA